MYQLLRQATGVLLANRLRTALTTLGLVIGIATIVIVLSAGEGFRSFIETQAEGFGANIITIETRVPPSTRSRQSGGSGSNAAGVADAITTFTMRDIEAVQKLSNVRGAYGAALGQQVVSKGQTTKNTFIFGASADRFTIDKGTLAAGRFYSEQEDRGAEQVAVLGADVAMDLFGNDDPLQKTIRVGSYNFVVIGVYERRGSFGFSNDDQQVFVPLRTLQKKLLGIDFLFYGVAQVNDPALTEATVEDIADILRKNHGITDPAKDDFLAQSAASALGTFSTILQGVTLVLIAIAAISLVVGGVGIMNIMYVAVTERISEIGLKKAVGATNGDILREFLLETVLLTLVGGVTGSIVGVGLSFVVAQIAAAIGLSWKFAVPLSGIAIGVGVSLLIGLIFGVFPARKAARLEPMEALRYE
jgi:putative ABC transport system permease protein